MQEIQKRDGRVAPFDQRKIEAAVSRCLASLAPTSPDAASPNSPEKIAEMVTALVAGRYTSPTVERVQDSVEVVLLSLGLRDAAQHYMAYRDQRAVLRQARSVPDEVRAKYAEGAEMFGDDPLRLFQLYDKYSRYRYDFAPARRETWPEAADRAIDFLRYLVVENCGSDRLTSGEWAELRDGIVTMDALPSMRLMSQAGEAAKRDNVEIFNCFSGGETFLTPSGPLIFQDHVGETHRVRCADGEWRDARVEAFGRQEVFRVKLRHWNGGKSGNFVHEVYPTRDHRWLLLDGSETTRLQVGDKLLSPSVNVSPSDEGWLHGFVFGDGTLTYNDGIAYCQVRLCGRKAEYLDTKFASFGRSFPPSCNGDPFVYLGRERAYFKKLPTDEMITPEYVAGFLDGLRAADGSFTSCGNETIHTQDEDAVQWITRLAPLAGFKVLSVRSYTEPTNYGPRSAPLRSILLGKAQNSILRVESIDSIEETEVFCVVEPVTGTFVLGNGQITGNCAYQAITDLESFRESLMIAMAGCGDAFSVESQFVRQLPVVRYQRPGCKPDVFVVPDTSEGWGEALSFGVERWFDGGDVDYDFSQLRRAGAILRVKGGRASGPGPLRSVLAIVRRIILSRQGSMLRPIDGHDIVCATGEAGNSGGQRRTAKLSLGDWGDTEHRDAKSAFGWWNEDREPWRANANNSAVWPDGGPSQIDLIEQMGAMFRSKSGERGIFSRENALRTMPPHRAEYLRANGGALNLGTNPCQPDFAPMLTPSGIRTMAEVDVGSIIWSGQRWTKVKAKAMTGVKPVYEYRTTAGRFVGTENHRVIQDGERVEARDAETIDVAVGPSESRFKIADLFDQDIMDGWVFGDGSVHKASGDLVHLYVGAEDGDIHAALPDMMVCHRPGLKDTAWEVKTTIQAHEIPMTYERRVPHRFYAGTAAKVRGFLRGLYSANGSVVANRVTLKAASLPVIHAVQEMLSSVGIASYYTTNRPHKTVFGNGEYECRESYDLNVSGDRAKFASLIGFVQRDKVARLASACAIPVRESLRKTSYEVREVVHLGDFPVYDITVEADEHTYWTGGLLVSNCGEIYLQSRSFCNLSQAVCRPADTVESLRRKVRLATILGTIQSMATHYPHLRADWARHAREERLLGVDISGQADCQVVRDGAVMRELRDVAWGINNAYAQRLGINPSMSVTCCKPNGNSSVAIGAGPGIHGHKMRYGIRNARVSTHSAVYRVLRACGVPMDPENGQEEATATKWVVHFPMRAPEGSIIAPEQSAVDQLEHWLLNKLNWTTHNPSCTIEYSPDEMIAVIEWVWAHRDVIGGLSFLPRDGSIYRQMPYQPTTLEEYEAAKAAFPKIDWALIAAFEAEDTTTSAREMACAAGACSIDDMLPLPHKERAEEAEDLNRALRIREAVAKIQTTDA